MLCTHRVSTLLHPVPLPLQSWRDGWKAAIIISLRIYCAEFSPTEMAWRHYLLNIISLLFCSFQNRNIVCRMTEVIVQSWISHTFDVYREGFAYGIGLSKEHSIRPLLWHPACLPVGRFHSSLGRDNYVIQEEIPTFGLCILKGWVTGKAFQPVGEVSWRLQFQTIVPSRNILFCPCGFSTRMKVELFISLCHTVKPY